MTMVGRAPCREFRLWRTAGRHFELQIVRSLIWNNTPYSIGFSEAYFQLGICVSGKQETMPAALEAMKKCVEIGKKPDQVEAAKQMIKAMGGK
jgi:hypothetical protein